MYNVHMLLRFSLLEYRDGITTDFQQATNEFNMNGIIHIYQQSTVVCLEILLFHDVRRKSLITSRHFGREYNFTILVE